MRKKHITLEFFRDINGNRKVRVKAKNTRGSFSIQTNGNMPNVHRFNVQTSTIEDLQICLIEIAQYIKQVGTFRQRIIMHNVLAENGLNWKDISEAK